MENSQDINPVAWQFLNQAGIWSECTGKPGHDFDGNWYKKQGFEVRALYAAPQKEQSAGDAERLQTLLKAVQQFLMDNDPDGFGCACTPHHMCGPCSAYKRQTVLRDAIAAIAQSEGK